MNVFQEIFAQMVKESNVTLATESNETTQSSETEIIVYCKINNFDGLQKASKIEVHEQLETEFKNGVRCRVRRTGKSPVIATEADEVDASQTAGATEEQTDTSESATAPQVTEDNGYCFTFKLQTKSDEGFEANQEFNVEVDKDFFEGFRNVAEQRVLKTRYEFASDKIVLTYGEGENKKAIEIPDIKYEVDVYTDQDGTVFEWCKVDIEVDAILDYLAQHHSELQNIKLNVKITHLPFEPSDTILTLSATEEQKAFVDSLWKDHFRLSPKDTAVSESVEAPEE